VHHHATDPLLAGRAESEVPCRAVRLSSFRGRPLARILEPPGRQRLSAAAVTVAANSDAAAIFDLLAQSSSVGRSVGRRGRYHRRDCSGWTATDARPPTHSMLLSLRRIAAVERCADSIVTHTHTHTASLLHHGAVTSLMTIPQYAISSSLECNVQNCIVFLLCDVRASRKLA